MNADDLAAAFSVGLEEELTADQFDEVLSRNASESDPNICHSHDFCDANEVMAEAFSALDGGELNPTDEKQAALVNEAWSIAKRSGFNVK